MCACKVSAELYVNFRFLYMCIFVDTYTHVYVTHFQTHRYINTEDVMHVCRYTHTHYFAYTPLGTCVSV